MNAYFSKGRLNRGDKGNNGSDMAGSAAIANDAIFVINGAIAHRATGLLASVRGRV